MALYNGRTEVYKILTPDWSVTSINICDSTHLISEQLTPNLNTSREEESYPEDQEQISGRI